MFELLGEWMASAQYKHTHTHTYIVLYTTYGIKYTDRWQFGPDFNPFQSIINIILGQGPFKQYQTINFILSVHNSMFINIWPIKLFDGST